MQMSASMKPPLQRIFSLLQPDRSDLWIVAAYSVAIGLLTLALPVASQSLINTVAFGTVLQPIIVLSILLFAALIAASALQVLRHWLVEVLQRRVFVRVTGDAGDRLIHARSSFFDNVHGPELVNRFLDVAIVQKSIAVLLIDGLTILMQTVAGLLLLAVYHPLLLLFDAVLFAMIIFILFGLGRGAIRTSIAESQAKYEVLSWLEELARHRGTFRSSQGMHFGWSRTNERAASYIEERKSHFRVEIRQIIG
jgi:ABC-type bacteriocin/lantibiotic exporter with double-glycine peptidase domain